VQTIKLNLKPVSEQTLVERLRNRAAIRRQITTRKSVQENQPDRIADLLDEAALEFENLLSINEEMSKVIWDQSVSLKGYTEALESQANDALTIALLKTDIQVNQAYIKYLESRLVESGVGFHKKL
jgi:nicotinamide riboside kinase